MNPYNPCDDCSQQEAEQRIPDIINKNEIIVNALINDGHTVVHNLIEFNDKQINKWVKQIGKHLNGVLANHDDLITELVSAASSAMASMIAENQIKVDMLGDIFHGVAGAPQVQQVDVKVNTGSTGPQPVNTETILRQVPAPLQQTPLISAVEQRAVPPPYTSEIGGQSSVDVAVNPAMTQFASTVTSTDQGTTVVFNPTVVNTRTQVAQAVEAHKERTRKREEAGETKKGESFPVDPQADPIAWKFAPDDTKWRATSAAFLGPAYELLLHVDSMEEYQQHLDDAFEWTGG